MSKLFWEILLNKHIKNEDKLKPYLKDRIQCTLILTRDGFYQFPHKHPNRSIVFSIPYSTSKNYDYGLIKPKCLNSLHMSNKLYVNLMKYMIIRYDTNIPFEHQEQTIHYEYYEIGPYTFLKKEITADDIQWYIVIEYIPKTKNILQFIEQIIRPFLERIDIL